MISTALISTRHQYWSLADVYGPIAIGVCLIILLLVVWAVLRYRRRPEAARWQENNPLEAGYAVVLTLVAAFLLYLTFSYEHRVDTVANRQKPSLTIDVTAGRWEWQFTYPRYGIVEHSGTVGDEPLVVPTNQPIRFNTTSIDVIHGFWIPEIEFKHDLFPGKVQSQVLTFPRTGTFGGQCSAFCGLRHPEMVFHVVAMTRAGFAAWIASNTGGRAS
ncbi:MAG TPA: cytochrome c oxidase subunit II [Solirubrobacteraceae bacterium]|nr:cytochrome c oxidase subunit II [Solirubrobacteraceae bacterium]